MEPKKLNFFEQINYAVTKPKQYNKLSMVSGGRLTGFVFLLMLIVTIISTLIPIVNAFTGSDGIYNRIQEELPYFEMKDGNLFVEERYENFDNNNYILVDTTIDAFNYEDIDKNYDQVFLISKTNYFQYSAGKTQEFDFKVFQGYNFTKDIIEVFKPFVYIILALVVVFIYLFGVGGYFLSGLFYSLLGLFASSVSNTKLSFRKIFIIAIYSKVTMKLVYTLTGILGLAIPSGVKNIIAIIVTCTYLVFGILSHKSEESNSDSMRMTQNNNYYNNNGNYNDNNYNNNNYDNNNYNNNNYNNNDNKNIDNNSNNNDNNNINNNDSNNNDNNNNNN